MATETFRDPDLAWLDHVRPVGLVVAPRVLKELGLPPLHQTPAHSAQVAELLNPDPDAPALTDPWAFVSKVLGWEARHVAGSPGGPEVPAELTVRLPEHSTTLAPDWAVAELGQGGAPWQLLVRIEAAGVDPDTRNALDGWEATPHQRFERLLRDTGVFAGLMVTDKGLRLVYAPRGETSGHLSFPLRPLATVAGRPMLAGLKLVLDSFRLFSDGDDRRLPALLKQSRDAQASVSTELAGQVLGALHELLRGLDAAAPDLIRELARSNPGHLYEGLLTVLMRLVFILYAEDRDLLPSRPDARAREIYETSYSVRGLYDRLVEDAALNPDTMDERRGAWGRLLALFRLVHKGHRTHFVQARGGKLFDPHEFPFLEGRKDKDDNARILDVSDGSILRILEGLMTLKPRGRERERLSYRALDVEQIGSVYETVMGFTVEGARGNVLAIRAGKNNRTPVFVTLDDLLSKKGKDRIKDLKETAGRALTPAQAKPVEEARTVDELAAALDAVVDERGSPRHAIALKGTPILQPTNERRRTGSHYTPRSLTAPIVTHALEPAFERLGSDATPQQVLELKVCDPAMGSGAFLVEACRVLANRLVAAWARWPDKRPKIPADEDEELHARRLVAQRCLYGVDKNPRAVDLARLSLWLATLARDHEFTFLDHALKCGDSLVGLSPAQIAAANWNESKPGLPLFRQLVRDQIVEAEKARAEIQSAPDDTMRAIQEARHKHVETRLSPVRIAGDAVVSAFFAADKPKAREKTRAEIESYLSGAPVRWDLLEAASRGLRIGEYSVLPFHWAVEFPEIFQRERSGFDAIVGNPPFLGGTRISTVLGKQYLNYLMESYSGGGNRADLVIYFLRRSFDLINNEGAFGLIGTNTLAEGDTRLAGLRFLINRGAIIFRAVRNMSWPGEAAVKVSVVHVRKTSSEKIWFNGKSVTKITAFLLPGERDLEPKRLKANTKTCFEGYVPYASGFLFCDDSSDAHPLSLLAELRQQNPSVDQHVVPFLGGEELNDDPRQNPKRFAIYFGTMSIDQAKGACPELVELLEKSVKPERERKGPPISQAPWWLFWRPRAYLHKRIGQKQHYLALSKVSKHLAVARIPSTTMPSNRLAVILADSFSSIAILQSRVHETWARFFGYTLEDRPVYSGTDCFETFPFPINFEDASELQTAGQDCYEYRSKLMIARSEGLTKTYNRFHDRNENAPDVVRLRDLHVAVDKVVLRAYGWDDLADRASPKFIEQEGDESKKAKIRLDWPVEFKDEVLARLLALNAERAQAERAAGLVDAADGDDAEIEDERESA